MAFYLSPGVFVNEIDKSNYIAGVATSVSVIVLRNTLKGPEMKTVLITNEGDLIKTFGEPTEKMFYDVDNVNAYVSTANGYEDMFSAIGYLKHGNRLYCTRTMPMSATFAGTVKTSASDEWEQYTKTNALKLLTKTYTYDDPDVKAIYDPDELHLQTMELVHEPTSEIAFIAKDRGKWGNGLGVLICDYTTQSAILSGGGPRLVEDEDFDQGVVDIFKGTDSRLNSIGNELLVIVMQGDFTILEVHNVSLNEIAVDDQGQTKYIEELINTQSQYVRVIVRESFKNSTVPSDWVTKTVKEFNGGVDMGTNTDTIEDGIINEAYDMYSQREEIDVNLFIDSNKSETVKKFITSIAQNRMDAMAICDVQRSHVVNNRGNEARSIARWRRGNVLPDLNMNSSYVALYGNWLEVYDRYNRKYRWVPASGYIAGLYAYTDNVSDPWFAPAGLNRGIINDIRRIAWNPTKGERDELYQAGINPIVSFSGKGTVVWGQKTMLDKASAFDRVNVRRLFLTIEKAIANASMYFVMEPNDRETRQRLLSMINPFLADVVARRGIYDFLVVCDETNNTPERIDRNELWVDLKIKPVKAAEFIVLNFIAVRTGVSWSEV